MGASIAAGPHATSNLLPVRCRGSGQSVVPTIAGRRTGIHYRRRAGGASGPMDAVRGAKPLGCCRSVLAHRVAPLSAVPCSDPASANTCLPLRFGRPPTSLQTIGESRPGRYHPSRLPLPHRHGRSGRIPARDGAECCERHVALHFAPDGDRGPRRAQSTTQGCFHHSVSEHRSHSFAHPQISPKAPAGWLRCKPVMLASSRSYS